MASRYSLRFESGEREGEEIEIEGTPFSIGRRPGQSLQILDASVSGHHAEITVDDRGALLRDVGSTNGTRVRGERVLEKRLGHGDRIAIGNVFLTFVDAIATETLALRPSAPSDAAPGVERVSSKALARAGERSRLGLVVLAVLALGGGAAWYWLGRTGPLSARVAHAVASPAENLLAGDYSFESDAESWTRADDAPAMFLKSSEARYSGELGFSCDLEPGAWAVARSEDERADASKEYGARGMLRSAGGAAVRLGLEFASASDADPAPASLTVWSDAVEGAEFAPVEVACAAPAGYAIVRVLVAASAAAGAGRADVDDVSLVARPSGARRTIAFGERRLELSGDPARAATLFHAERALVTDLHFLRADAARRFDAIQFSASEDANAKGAIAIEARGAGGACVLGFACEPALYKTGAADARAPESIATVGSDGYKTHPLEFRREGATDLLLGAGRDLVRMRFPSPVTVTGASERDGARIQVELPAGACTATLQLDFQRERTEAGNVAHAARSAEKKHELGEALRQWSLLLDSHPYEESLVREAEAARGRLIHDGLEELQSVQSEVEEARFFRLAALFEQCRVKALSIAERYAASEVEERARALAHEVESERAGLARADAARERERLESIARAFRARKAEGLARTMDEYIRERFEDAR